MKKRWGKNIKKNDGSQRNAKSKGGGLELKNLSIIESRVYFRNVKDELDIQVSGKWLCMKLDDVLWVFQCIVRLAS